MLQRALLFLKKNLKSERGNKILRWIDTYLGIPVVTALGLTKRILDLLQQKNPTIEPPSTIGILATAAIGDSIVLSAVLQDLKRHFPKTRLLVFAGKNNSEAFRFFSFIDHIIVIDIKSPWKTIQALRGFCALDVLIDSGQWARINSLLVHFSKANLKIGFHTQGQHRHLIFDIAIRHRSDAHEIDNFRALVTPLGVQSTSFPKIDVAPSKEGIDPAVKSKMVVLHMFASGLKPELKQWPINYWPIVINQLCTDGYTVGLTGVSSDFEMAEIVRSRCRQPQKVKNYAGKLSLNETAQVLAKSHLVVSVNTGVLHLAAAVGAHVVNLEGPVSPDRWGPLTLQKTTIQSQLPCSPCLYLGFDFGCPINRCMQSISPNLVNRTLSERFGSPKV